MTRAALFAAFVATVWASNWLIEHVGIIDVGFVEALEGAAPPMTSSWGSSPGSLLLERSPLSSRAAAARVAAAAVRRLPCVTAPRLEDRQERVRHALSRPDLFLEWYFRPYDPNWVDVMPLFAQQMLAFMATVPRGVIMLPPEFMKTTIAQGYALWLTVRSAAFQTLLRGMLMSEEEGMAKGNLAVIKWHIENNERLREDFVLPDGTPLVRPSSTVDVWRDDAIVIERQGVSRDPTWQAKGIASKGVHGRRLTHFIGDDLVSPINAESPAMRKLALDTMELKVQTRMVAGAQMLVLANFSDAKDLPSTLAARKSWSVFRRPSLHLPGQPDKAPKDSDIDAGNCVSAWPGNWSMQRLLAVREDNPPRFRRIHLLDPRAELGERLSVGWLREVTPEETPFRYCRFYIGIDGAPGGDGDDLDFFNITILGVHEQHADVVESLDVRASAPRQVQLVGLMHDRYQRLGLGVAKIGIAKVALDAYFRGALAIARPDLTHKVEPVSTPGQKEVRLEGLGPYAQAGWLRFQKVPLYTLTSDPVDQHQEMTLYEEWRDFPFGKHDDRLDGLDVAIRLHQQFALVGDREHEIVILEG